MRVRVKACVVSLLPVHGANTEDKPSLLKHRKIAVHRAETQLRIFALQPVEHRFGGGMSGISAEQVIYRFPFLLVIRLLSIYTSSLRIGMILIAELNIAYPLGFVKTLFKFFSIIFFSFSLRVFEILTLASFSIRFRLSAALQII